MAQFIRVKNLPMQQVRNPRIFKTEFASRGEVLPVYSLAEQTFILSVRLSDSERSPICVIRYEQLEDPYLLMENEVLFEHMKQIYLLSWHAPLSLPTNERRQMSGGRALVTYSSTSIYPIHQREEERLEKEPLARF
jgi:hypothetical protein